MEIKNTQNFSGLNNWFLSFKGGKRTSSNGVVKEWTNEELDQIANRHNDSVKDNLFNGAPLVVGHPKIDAPAFGWVQAIRRVGNRLELKGAKVHDAFAKGVEEGQWPNRSISIGKDDKGYYLKHVGFLGAAAPAVEGMEAIYNAADDDESFEYTADTTTPNVLKRTFRRLRDFLIEKDGVEAADRVIPEHEIDDLQRQAEQVQDDIDPSPNFNQNTETGDEPMTEFTQEQLDDAVAKAKADGITEGKETAESEFSAEKEKTQAKLDAEKKARQTLQFNAEVDKLVDQGKLLPAQTEGMAEFMAELTSEDGVQFEFSQGEGDKKETVKKSPLLWFQEFTASMGKQIEVGQEIDSDDVSFNKEDPQELAVAAAQYQKEQLAAGNTISISQAVAHVNK